ncbi:hypothetical protein HMPREF1574_01017 [Gardnerella pickettii JCP7659]|nr:hypothetical protein HMPREF1574_01017 [Gardnerella pickettii JCP7659]
MRDLSKLKKSIISTYRACAFSQNYYSYKISKFAAIAISTRRISKNDVTKNCDISAMFKLLFSK